MPPNGYIQPTYDIEEAMTENGFYAFTITYGENSQVDPTHEHNYTGISYEWNEDYSACIAIAYCENCEERITEELDRNHIEYLALSKFIPSIKRQQENFNLVKELYINNLKKYSDILSQMQIQNLLDSSFSSVSFEIKEYPFLPSQLYPRFFR